jgi:biotin operon repressor
MDIELGIRNVVRPVNFSTDQSAEEVNEAITQAVDNGKTISLVDSKGRRIVVPAGALGYAIIGSETKHAVGFNNL